MESLLNEIMNTSISSGSDDFESMDEKWFFCFGMSGDG